MKEIENKIKFKFRRNPRIFSLFNFEEKANCNSSTNEKININKLKYKLKFGSYKLGNVLGSVSFGVFLFAMQSYFLRQNLGLTGKSFISD